MYPLLYCINYYKKLKKFFLNLKNEEVIHNFAEEFVYFEDEPEISSSYNMSQ